MDLSKGGFKKVRQDVANYTSKKDRDKVESLMQGYFDQGKATHTELKEAVKYMKEHKSALNLSDSKIQRFQEAIEKRTGEKLE